MQARAENRCPTPQMKSLNIYLQFPSSEDKTFVGKGGNLKLKFPGVVSGILVL